MRDDYGKSRGPLGLIGLLVKGVWLALTRTALFFLTIGFLFAVALFFSVIGAADAPLQVTRGAALRIPLTAAVVEEPGETNALAETFGNIPPEIGIRDVEAALRAAREDERIAGVVVELGGVMNLTHARAIADMLRDFKSSGKPVYAHGVFFGQNELVVAAAADDSVIHNEGFVWLEGYSIKPLYYRELLDKLSVDVEVFRVGTFKAAVEPYLRDDMSEEARENYRELGEGLFAAARADISDGRDMADADLLSIAREAPERLAAAGGDFAKAAVTAGLVDRRAAMTEIRADLRSRFGETSDDVGYVHVDARDYAEQARKDAAAGRAGATRIGVVLVDGTISLGENEDGVAGSESIVRHLRRAAEDDAVKAVVLRVDSPGGSVLASEFIREQALAVKEAGKPLVVSMGPVAASGGYWISANADEIWATPTTITGSIGVFSLLPNFNRALGRLGINADGVEFDDASGLGDPREPLGEGVRLALQSSVEDIYRDFIALVSEGRGMTPEAVDAVGQGRVWLGARALELGLVDRMGGFEDTVRAAAERAGLERWSLTVYRDDPTPIEAFLDSLFIIAAPKFVEALGLDPALLRGAGETVEPLVVLGRDVAADPRGRVALCTACLAAGL